MTLKVRAYRYNDAGEMEFVDPNDASRNWEWAGFERWRNVFYGGTTARSLGLPSLAESNFFAEGEALATLLNEASVMLQNIEQFVPEANADVQDLQFHLQNILRAIDRAQQAQGGVVIW